MDLNLSPCPVCGHTSELTRGEMYDDRYGYPGTFDLLRCKDCGHKFLRHALADADLVRLYTDYYPRRNFSLNDFHPLPVAKGFKSWLNGDFRAYSVVPKGVTVLDIGCGYCESLAYHTDRGCRVFGVEADQNAVSVANHFGFNLHSGTFSAANYVPGSFDYVTMDQVIEHVIDPSKTLAEIAAVLKPGGVLALTTPNSTGLGAHCFGKKWINWHTPYHLHHFSRDSLHRLAERTGFRIVKLRTLTSSAWLYFQWLHSLQFPKPGQVSSFWCSGTATPAPSRFKIRFFTLLHRLWLDRIMTRILDMLGVGDNWLVVMVKVPEAPDSDRRS